MKRVFICLMIVLMSSVSMGTVDTALINFDTVTSGRFDQNLRGWVSTLNTDITNAAGFSNRGTGLTFYVDSAVGNDSYVGTSLSTATATLDAAVNLCTADRGDVIFVMQGHAENLSAADAVDVDVAGVTIIGLGVGDLRPTFTYTNAAGEIVIGADDVLIANIICKSSVTAVLTAMNIEAGSENCEIRKVDFVVDADGTDEFLDTITVVAATDSPLITGCLFHSGDASNAGPQSAINFVDSNDIRIIDNTFFGDYAVACVQNETTASSFITIKDNVMFNGIIGGTAGLNAQPCVELVATTTGVIVDNSFFCNVATPDLAVVAADCFLAGNTYSESEGSAGATLLLSDSAGLKCAYVQPASIAAVTNLFQVTGGPIIIRDIVGVVTTNIVATTCLINYNIDPVEPATDTVFGTDGTALEINGDAAGTVYTWDGVIATDLTATTNGVLLTQGTDVANGILCPQGMVELAATATNAGVIAFYMVYSPLSPQSTVIPQ